MDVEEFYNENYKDANYFYSYIKGVPVISPNKIQEAMESYAIEYHADKLKLKL